MTNEIFGLANGERVKCNIPNVITLDTNKPSNLSNYSVCIEELIDDSENDERS